MYRRKIYNSTSCTLTRNSRSFRKRGRTLNPRDISASVLQLPAIRMFRTGDTTVITIKSQWMNSLATIGRVQMDPALLARFCGKLRIVIETLGSFQHRWEEFSWKFPRNDFFDKNNWMQDWIKNIIWICETFNCLYYLDLNVREMFAILILSTRASSKVKAKVKIIQKCKKFPTSWW